MRLLFLRRLLIGFLCMLLLTGELSAADVTELREITGWMDDYCLIRIEGGRDAAVVRRAVEKCGGRVAVIASDDVMLGWIEPGLERRILGIPGVGGITRSPVDVSSFASPSSRMGAVAFNWIASGEGLLQSMSAAETRGEPLDHDAFAQPPEGRDPFEKVPVEMAKGFSTLNASSGCGNSEAMTGTVSLTLFFVESDGTGSDPDTYTWTAQHQADTYNRAVAALSWWSSKALSYGYSLTYNVIVKDATDPVCQVPYEPITHSSSQDDLWINKIMQNIGSSSVYNYNSSVRATTGSNWAYSAFVVYNPPGAPTTFTDGYFAYAYLGGPYTQLCYANDGWGAGNFGNVLAHETAHIFWANDEYYQPGYGGCMSCGTYGNCPRPSQTNANCSYCNSSSVPCIMKNGAMTNGLCAYTPPQIGWLPAANHAPVSSAGADQTVATSTMVVLDGTASYDPDNTPITYAWQQVSGTGVSLANAATSTPSFAAPGSAGSLTFRLTVSDGSLSNTDDVVVTVTGGGGNQTPIADAGDDQAVATSAPVSLDGSGSHDPDGAAITFQWVQTAGSAVVLSGASTSQPTFSAPGSEGQLSFRLTVSDGALAAADDVVVNVTDGGSGGPSISSIVSKKGKPGTSAKIICRGFGTERNLISVRFGGRSARVNKAGSGYLKVTIPRRLESGTTVDVIGEVDGKTSNAVQFAVR